MKWRTLEGGMRKTLLRILVATVVATLLTYLLAGIVFVALENRYIQPANYSEQHVANVETLVRERGAALLNTSAAAFLDEAVGDSGLTYQVVDAEGHTLYGTYEPEGVELDRQMLLNEINQAHSEADGYVHTVPIFDETTLVGAVRCEYDFALRFERTTALSKLVLVFLVLALVSPLLWLLLFSRIFSRRFAESVRTPLAFLRAAAEKIEARDLDFHIDYEANNELGDLCRAFEETRHSLSASLTKQWRMEEEHAQMVAALAHDLKTPLSVIKAYSESLADDTPLDEEQRGYLDVIALNVDRSAALIRRIQDVSLLENARVSQNAVPLDLETFLHARVQEYQVQARRKNVDVALDTALCQKHYALNEEALRRILDNLVANSMDVLSADGHILIRAREVAETLRLSVQDDGPGFSVRDLKHATEQFYRGDEARQTAAGHAGLGLYIVRTLATQLGGSVELANGEGGGACVTVIIPLAACTGAGAGL